MKIQVQISIKEPESGAVLLPSCDITYEDDTDTTISELKGHILCFEHILKRLKESSDKRRYNQLVEKANAQR